MISARKVRQGLAAGSVALLLVTGCLRLNPPEYLYCEEDGDCDDGEKCVHGSCIANDECHHEEDCRNGQICQFEKCVAPQCDPSSDAVCAPLTCANKRCLTRCNDNEHCQTGFYCAQGQCLAGPAPDGVRCKADSSCRSAHCCYVGGTHSCAATCPLSIGDRCSKPSECASGWCCQGANGLASCAATPCAMAECDADGDCATGQSCEMQKCVKRPVPLGGSCKLNGDCSSQLCKNSVCVAPAKAGAACGADADCGVGGTCCDKSSSANERLCSASSGRCPSTIGGKCQADSDCAIGATCNGDYCTKACSTNAECGTSPWGVANVCSAGATRSCLAGCSIDFQCESYVSPFFNCTYQQFCDF